MEFTVEKVLNWFEYNNLKANASKWHFFLSPYQHTSIHINRSAIKSSNSEKLLLLMADLLMCIESSNSEKLLGITIHSDFTFKEHINTLYRKASQKLHAFSKILQYLSQHKKRILFKTFIMWQFNYCPLVWMCYCRGLNKQINTIHKRALRIVYQDNRIYKIYYWSRNLCLSSWKTYNIWLQISL